MPNTLNRPPVPKERPVALAVTGPPPLRTILPRAERFPAAPTFPGPRQTKATGTGRGDMIGLTVFVVLIVLGLIASARALLVM